MILTFAANGRVAPSYETGQTTIANPYSFRTVPPGVRWRLHSLNLSLNSAVVNLNSLTFSEFIPELGTKIPFVHLSWNGAHYPAGGGSPGILNLTLSARIMGLWFPAVFDYSSLSTGTTNITKTFNKVGLNFYPVDFRPGSSVVVEASVPVGAGDYTTYSAVLVVDELPDLASFVPVKTGLLSGVLGGL